MIIRRTASGGDDTEKLDAALTKKLGEDDKQGGAKSSDGLHTAPLQRDELGLYSI